MDGINGYTISNDLALMAQDPFWDLGLKLHLQSKMLRPLQLIWSKNKFWTIENGRCNQSIFVIYGRIRKTNPQASDPYSNY